MKARTHRWNGENHYEVYFTYEDFYGGEIFRSYDEMQKMGDLPNCESCNGFLVGWLHSFYWGCTERIDMWELNGRPTISKVKEFINHCKKVIE